MQDRKKKQPRIALMTAASVAAAAVFTAILFVIQVYGAGGGTTDSSSVKSYNVTVGASRGEILDLNGNALVYNETVNTLTFNALDFPKENAEINTMLISLINLLEGKGETWIDTLPLVMNADGSVAFAEDKESEITKMRSPSMLNLNPYATAQNCYDAMLEEFGIEGFSKTDALKLMSVRYNMKKLGFSVYTPYTFSEDVSVRTLAYVKENGNFYKGVDAEVRSVRKYTGNGTLAAHLLGTVGALSADEYKEKKTENETAIKAAGTDARKAAEIKARAYAITDDIGKNGIEKAMEEYLRGKNGVKTLSVDKDGNVSESYSVVPEQGGTVISTINKDIQEIAQEALRERISEVTDNEAIAKGLTPAGAVVVQDVNTGAVLAAATYPDFSLTTYYDDYNKLSQNPGKPLWNRAFQSAYSPGSTMKPCVALAGLEEGIITKDTRYLCTGIYTYIDQTFACFNKNAHGNINVQRALGVSCNIFFFEIARQLGIEKLNAYAKLFGLGQKTGIEIDEAQGILAGIEYRDSIGKGWKPGETLLASIGQSDNSFTPLQLSNYCAAIANGGTRYVPYLVSKVLSADYKTTLYEHTPEVAVQTNISKESLETVKGGMYIVANETSCEPYLGHLKYKVACKTGTAEKTRRVNGVYVDGTDGFLIAFGPYEDAEISIAVVIENAGSGSSTAQVAADIFEYYFSKMGEIRNIRTENTLID